MPVESTLPVSNKEDPVNTIILELELFAVKVFHSMSPMDTRIMAQEKSFETITPYLLELKKLVGLFLFSQRQEVYRLAILCNAKKYFAGLQEYGTFDFIDIVMNLSTEAEVQFVGDQHSQEGKAALQILAGIDMMFSIHHLESMIEFISQQKILGADHLTILARDTFLIMRNLGFIILVTKLKSKDDIDTEIAKNIFSERASHTKSTFNTKEYDAQRYNESYEKIHDTIITFSAEHFINKEMPLIAGRSKGGQFNIRDRLNSFLEQIITNTGENDLVSICNIIKNTYKETEPIGDEMLFYWDDESDTKTVRAAWLNADGERKSAKVALKTLDKHLNKIKNKLKNNVASK